MDEDQDVEGDQPFWRPDRLRQEVALDQCGGVDADELGPRTVRAIGSGGDVVFFEDRLYSGTGDRFNAEFSQLAEDASAIQSRISADSD